MKSKSNSSSNFPLTRRSFLKTGAVLTNYQEDVYRVLAAAPAEVPGLLDALRAGKIDGSSYDGECGCLVSTLERVRGTGAGTIVTRDSNSAAERTIGLPNCTASARSQPGRMIANCASLTCNTSTCVRSTANSESLKRRTTCCD